MWAKMLNALATIITILLLANLTTQTHNNNNNNNLFRYPISSARITTSPTGQRYHAYPDGTPINLGASSSFNPFTNLTLAPGYTLRQIGSVELTYFVPVLWTTSVFEAFYLAIFQRAAGEFWGQNLRPSKSITISIGQLHLSFSSAPAPIPWALVAAFAWNMWQAARRGWTAGYAAQIVSPQGATTSVVMMATNIGGENTINQDFIQDSASVVGSTAGDWIEPELVTDEDLSDSDGDGGADIRECKRPCRRPPPRARR